jgi:hypothetical protein
MALKKLAGTISSDLTGHSAVRAARGGSWSVTWLAEREDLTEDQAETAMLLAEAVSQPGRWGVLRERAGELGVTADEAWDLINFQFYPQTLPD